MPGLQRNHDEIVVVLIAVVALDRQDADHLKRDLVHLDGFADRILVAEQLRHDSRADHGDAHALAVFVFVKKTADRRNVGVHRRVFGRARDNPRAPIFVLIGELAATR